MASSADPLRLRITIERQPPYLVRIDGPDTALSGAVPDAMRPGAAPQPRPADAAPRDATEILDDFRAAETPDVARIGTALLDLLGLSAADAAALSARLQTKADFELVVVPGPDWAAALPWEALQLPGKFFPALAPNVRLFRQTPGPAPPPSPALPLPVPLRILVVNGLPGPQAAPGAEYGQQEARLVRNRLWGAGLERHDIRVMSTTDWPDAAPLVSFVQEFEPHILHLVCHGDAGGDVDDPRLLLGNQDTCIWTGDAIDTSFGRAPDLVVLHACWGGSQAANAGSIAQAFLKAGAGAVWSMQGSLDVKHAAPLAETLYGELSRHGDVARAASAARRLLVAGRNVTRNDRAWAIPALTINQGARRLLPSQPSGRLRLAELTEAYLPPLVDRKEPLAQLWDAKDAVTILTGPAEQGKTHLARWLVARAQAAGQRACRIEAARGSASTPVELRQLLEMALLGLWGEAPRLPDAICAFLHDYPFLSAPQQRDAPPMPSGWVPPGMGLQGGLRGVKKDQILDRFVAAVQGSAPEEGLLLVIDLNEIDVRAGDMFPDLADRVILPWTLAGTPCRARLLIVMRDDQRAALDAVPGQPSSMLFTRSRVIPLRPPDPTDTRVAMEELLDLAESLRAANRKPPLDSSTRDRYRRFPARPRDMPTLWRFALEEGA